MKFEKQIKRVIYVPCDDIYRVTFDTLRVDKRVPKDSRKHLVGVAAAVSYWDSVDKRNHCLGCARTIKEAFSSGDRYLLDTCEARKAAELVADLSCTRPDDIDICSALSDLLNEIAKVRLSNTTVDDYEVLPACREALERCFATPGYTSWSDFSKRRKFLYSIDRRFRTPVVYTVMSLYYGQGATPILTSRQRSELMKIERGDGIDGIVEFIDECLRRITAYRFS